jgi:anti-anti-sigma factor
MYVSPSAPFCRQSTTRHGSSSVDVSHARLRVHSRAETIVVSVQGDVDATSIESTIEYARRFVVSARPVVLDLSAVDFICGDGYLGLVALDRECRQAGLVWMIVPSRAVDRLLRITDQRSELPLANSVPAALRMIDSLGHHGLADAGSQLVRS